MAEQTKELYITGNQQLDILLNRIAERLDRLEGIKPELDQGLITLDENKNITTTPDLLGSTEGQSIEAFSFFLHIIGECGWQ